MSGKLLYAQSGGVTAVINASAAAVIATARSHGVRTYAAHNGILGVLREDLVDTGKESAATLRDLAHTPGGAFGSCRYKLKTPEADPAAYARLIEVLAAHDVRWFLYNGGNDSADTAMKIAAYARRAGRDLVCVGVPKTVDNDLAVTDCSPGFGSVAKYVAVSIREAALDVASMALTSTKVFVLEVMGRHAGWIAAAGGLAQESAGDAPHIILFPEIPFDQQAFLTKVRDSHDRFGYCVIVVSEGVRDADGHFLAEAGTRDAFGHAQLGGVAPYIAHLVKDKLNYKYHWAVSDYLQRAARHIASKLDVAQSYAVGKAAVELALKGRNAVMPTIVRKSNRPYRWGIGVAALADVANQEKFMPRDFITKDGFGITAKARRYLAPLIQGEDYPPYRQGLPRYVRLKNTAVPKKLKTEFKI
ncbi:MAG: 6-phosphofructokinase [Gammaproteobacteria bacterium]|nr:6-phosphofructokinase [Gammaproteobacteria bacterium]